MVGQKCKNDNNSNNHNVEKSAENFKNKNEGEVYGFGWWPIKETEDFPVETEESAKYTPVAKKKSNSTI